MKNYQSITFTATRNTVTADKYVPYALYKQNQAIVEELGGQVCKGNEGFVAQFPTAAKAKAFVSKAVCEMSKKEYNATRKSTSKASTSEPKATAPAKAIAPKQGKAKAKETYITLTDDDGNTYKVPMSALGIVSVPSTKASAPAKAKAKATPKTAKATKKAKAVAPKTNAVTKGKGKSKSCPVDFSKLAGRGRTANKDAALLMRKAGYTDSTTAEYQAIWAEWLKVR